MRHWFWLTSLVLFGCGDSDDPPPPEQPATEVQGGLNRAIFTYACVSVSDAQCNVDAELSPLREESPFPSIAVGASFALSAKPVHDWEYTDLGVGTVAPEWLGFDAQSGRFVGKQAGIVSVVAVQGATPVDFANLRLVQPTRLKLLQGTPQGDFTGAKVDLGGGKLEASADVQFTFKFRAVAVEDDDSILAGSLPCTWTSSDPEVARLTSDPESNLATVVSGRAGTATITVSYGPLTGYVNLEVGQ